ncbi:MAG: hypothetical protein KJO07_12240 [Deltaproteobacteria bacterium]|jgi:hypothetical protein|nr:hypothetical protein [Deltaproteobacteria bacterium]
MRSRLDSLLLALVVAGLGCPPPAVYQSADTLEPGKWQLGGGLGVGSLRDDEQQIRVPTGDLQLFARRGVIPDLDLGLRLYSVGLEASVKYRFHRDLWSLAVMPGLSALGTNENALTTKAFHSFLTVPMLASRRLSERWSVSLGPKVITGLYWSTTSEPNFGLQVGGYSMFGLHLGRWTVMPEIDLARTVAGTVPVDGWVAHVGIGLAFER